QLTGSQSTGPDGTAPRAEDSPTPTPRRVDPMDALTRVTRGSRADRVTHVEQVPARVGRTAEWPDWVAPALRNHLVARGVDRPWAHQVATAELAWQGQHVITATGTASGKSLGYLL